MAAGDVGRPFPEERCSPSLLTTAGIRKLRKEPAATSGSITGNRASPCYAGRLAPDKVAATLARACGHCGTGAECLLNTVSQLEARGIHDTGQWHLRRRAARQIEELADIGRP
ncbi:MAG: gamma-glutamylcyclotransferase [Candidatus Accumulibacter sp.]|nr:gamma-glutamylcyclotransferase [Candidatus Accumulibacter conexus]